ncbi:MAG: hypothetical protein DHS20C17_34290 [Cyclobacteriaceae bacterium]|nr:MAG: hypothetical protein DHS20C17_34290 [Cyclobacteriaceae bacterium]
MRTKILQLYTAIVSAILTLNAISISAQSVNFAPEIDVSNGTVSGVTSLDAGDLNDDGLLDIVVLEGGKHAEKPTIAWFEQTRTERWTRHELGNPAQLDSFLGSAKCYDIDSDGDIDIVLTSDNHAKGPIRVIILENPGDSLVFQPWNLRQIASIPGFHANDMRIDDMDRNGKPDIIIRHKNPNSLRILFQKTKYDWITKTMDTQHLGNEGFAVGDLNVDSIPDISINGYWFKAPSEPMEGQYELFAIDTIYTTINPNTKEDIGDINGDGLNDIVISPAESFYQGKNHQLAWYQASTTPEIGSTWIKHTVKEDYNHGHSVKLIDMDMDNDLDLISGQAWTPKQITIFFNDGSRFSRHQLVVTGKGIYSGAFKDMDGDGDVDLVGEDEYSNKSKPWYYENISPSRNK